MCCLFGRGFESLQLHLLTYNLLFFRWLFFLNLFLSPLCPDMSKVNRPNRRYLKNQLKFYTRQGHYKYRLCLYTGKGIIRK